MPEIRAFYHDHEGALAVLSTLPGASRDLPAMTAERFAADTPFLPYHPGLILVVFGSVKSATATGFALNPEARSMIGIAQGVLSNPANRFVSGELGRTVSMDTENVSTLREAVGQGLERLQAARYVVPREDGVWEFLTGTKKSFEKEVAGVTVRQTDLRREARNRLAEVLHGRRRSRR